MKILYSLPHPADRLGMQGAGHVVRAAALLHALREHGHEIIEMEAAARAGSGTPVRLYRGLIKRLLPRPIAMMIRDWGRMRYGRTYGARLAQAALGHRPDVILETHIAFSLAGKIASQHSGIPLVLDDCAPAWEEEQEYGVGLKDQALAIHLEVIRHARLLVAVSESLRKALIEEGAPPERVVTIPNGIEAAFFAARHDRVSRREQLGIPADAVVIVYVGSFQPYHAVPLLLRSFGQIPPGERAHLLLVGMGQTFRQCRELAASLDIAHATTFTGAVQSTDVPSLLAAGDIAVLPGTTTYTNPMKLYEYMAAEKPVVAPRQDNVMEIATAGKDAVLFEPGSIPSLTQALTSLIRNPTLREQYGSSARQLAAAHTWQSRALALEQALNRVLEEKRVSVRPDPPP